jgi:hypothetical protein
MPLADLPIMPLTPSFFRGFHLPPKDDHCVQILRRSGERLRQEVKPSPLASTAVFSVDLASHGVPRQRSGDKRDCCSTYGRNGLREPGVVRVRQLVDNVRGEIDENCLARSRAGGVRGREKVSTGGQVEVSTGGQIKVPTPCSSCRSGTAGPDGDGEGANQTPPPSGSSIEEGYAPGGALAGG